VRDKPERVRFGIAGAGDEARALELPVLAGPRGPYEIRSITTHAGPAARSYRALLASGAVDALFLEASACQLEWVSAGLRSGLHIVCQTTPPLSQEGWQEMRELGRTSGAELMIASPLSFACLHREAAELAQSGRIGDPLMLSARVAARDPGVPLGRLLRVGLELARRLLGGRPGELVGVTGCDGPRALSLALRTGRDRLATLVCGDGGEPGVAYELVASDGSLRVSAPSANAAGTLSLASPDGAHARCRPSRVTLSSALTQASDAILSGRTLSLAQERLSDERVIRAIARELRRPRALRLKKLPADAAAPSTRPRRRRPAGAARV